MAAVSSSVSSAPEEFLCPISAQVMQDPTITSCSHTFEKSQIERWLASNLTCPTCRSVVTSLIANRALKACIDKLANIRDIKRPVIAQNIGWMKSLQYVCISYYLPSFMLECYNFVLKNPLIIGSFGVIGYAGAGMFFQDDFDNKIQNIIKYVSSTLVKVSNRVLQNNKIELVVTLGLSASLANNSSNYYLALSMLLAGASYIAGQYK